MKFKYYILLVYALFSLGIQAQSLDQCIETANKLYEETNYVKSIEFYKRVAYFDTSNQYADKVYKQIGNAYFYLKNYEEAISNYDKSYYFTADSIQKNDCIISIMRSFFASEKYLEGISEIQNLTVSLNDSQFRQKHFYLGLNYFFAGSMDSSEAHFGVLLGEDSLAQKKLHVYMQEALKIEKISPKKAKTLSYLLPGLGQLYAHDYKNAANSFLLNLGLLTVGYVTAYNYSVLDAVLGVYPWLQRYYKGGAAKAYMIASERKKNLKKKKMAQIISLLN